MSKARGYLQKKAMSAAAAFVITTALLYVIELVGKWFDKQIGGFPVMDQAMENGKVWTPAVIKAQATGPKLVFPGMAEVGELLLLEPGDIAWLRIGNSSGIIIAEILRQTDMHTEFRLQGDLQQDWAISNEKLTLLAWSPKPEYEEMLAKRQQPVH